MKSDAFHSPAHGERGAFRLDPKLSCAACGCFGAYPFDGEALCGECYAGRGSCCSAEFSEAAGKVVCEQADAKGDDATKSA